MKPLSVVVALISLAVAFSAISWITSLTVVAPAEEGSAESTSATAEEITKSKSTEYPFEVPETGPYPKAVLDDNTYEFGAMQVDQEKSHVFVVRNEGEAPLKLAEKWIQCQCTGAVIEEDPIPPGDFVEIDISWEPEYVAEEFHQRVQIWTNDPENRMLELHLKGRVNSLARLLPPGDWKFRKDEDDKTYYFAGMLLSPLLDEFKILEYESSSDAIVIDWEPLAKEEATELDVRSGYHIHGRYEGELPVGLFRETITLATDMVDDREFTIQVSGSRPGPFSIVGRNWIGGDMRFKMGEVPSSEGKSATLSMFVAREKEPIQLTVKQTRPDFLQLHLERDDSFNVAAREKYLMTFTVPPDAPIGSWQGDDVAMVLIGTNRESAPELKLFVEMTVVQ